MRISYKETGKKLSLDIYFNTRKRNWLKKRFLLMQKNVLETKPLEKPMSKNEFAHRELTHSLLSFTTGMLETIKNAEKYHKTIFLKKCRYRIYKKGKEINIETTFIKPLIDTKIRKSVIYLKTGIPKKGKKTRAVLYKNVTNVNFLKDHYQLLGEGTFRQKISDFKTVILNLKGDFRSIITLRVIGKSQTDCWFTIE